MNKILFSALFFLILEITCLKSDDQISTPSLSISTDQPELISNGTLKNETILEKAQEMNENNLTFKVSEKETISLKCPIDMNKHFNAQSDNYENYTDEEDLEDYSDYSDDDKSLELNRAKRENKELVIIQWYKDSTKINKFLFPNRFESENGYLKIKNVQLSDSGKYRCKLINGFGTVSSNVILIVQKLNQTLETTKVPVKFGQKKQIDSQRAPVFVNQDKMQSNYFQKQKGSQVRFNCRASASPKPDILWFKNGQVLNEEDYGITRSKWTLDLKDLRMDDNGNFTCQVYNKYGYINATFELIVYEDSQIFEGLDPLNSTITAGMDAVFNCKVKSSSVPNIKWMKQISKAEYANYVIQNSNGENMLLNDAVSNEKENDELKGFYALSTLPSLRVIEKSKSENSNFDDLSLNELLNGADYNLNSNSKQDDFNFELFVPNESNENVNFNINLKKSQTKNEAAEQSIQNNNDESVHYITLSSSPTIIEKFSYNKEKNYYISQLVIKQANVKDSGIYVCFGATTKGYSVRKSYLKVIPSLRPIQPSIFYSNDFSSLYKFKDLESLKSNNYYINNNENKPSVTPAQSAESLSTIQSIGYFIIIIPVILISFFAIISVCYLRKLDNQKENCEKCSITGFFKKFMSNSNTKSSSKNGLFCCPANLTHVLIQNTYDDVIDKKQNTFGKNTISTSCSSDNTNTLQCGSNSQGSLISDSTSATTVAYYATIPLLIDNILQSSPPPLPNSQPPTFSPSFNNSQASTINPNFMKPYVHSKMERTVSTPSMAYYKIVDNEMIDSNDQEVANHCGFEDDDSTTCASRFYYQLAPNGNFNFNSNSNNISNNYKQNF